MSPLTEERRLKVLASRAVMHGAYSTYVYWKCRCEACREGNARYHASRRAGRRPEDAAEHGTRSTYHNYGCRCEACCAAEAAYQRQRWLDKQ